MDENEDKVFGEVVNLNWSGVFGTRNESEALRCL
jgi:hypothetical protein